MIDTHTHLYDEQFATDRAETIARARAAGVDRLILPAVDSALHDGLMRMLDEYPDVCFGAMGVHPTSFNDNPNCERELESAERLLRTGRFVAVGEVGLDLYWSKDYLAEQLDALERQMDWARELSLPVILHVRDAWDELLPVIETRALDLCCVFHSFSGTIEHYKRIEAAPLKNFMLGIGGPVTYKRSALAEVLPEVPLSRLVLETDAPYLPPVPHRGRRNEPSYLPLIAQRVAELKNCTPEQVAKITTDNANSIFFA